MIVSEAMRQERRGALLLRTESRLMLTMLRCPQCGDEVDARCRTRCECGARLVRFDAGERKWYEQPNEIARLLRYLGREWQIEETANDIACFIENANRWAAEREQMLEDESGQPREVWIQTVNGPKCVKG